MKNINHYRHRIDSLRILELQAIIENKIGKMFHEYNSELDDQCIKALDGEIHASFIINQLCKIADSLEELT